MQWASGVHFRPTGSVSGIHMSEDYFGLEGGAGLKLCRMKSVCKDTCVCVCMSVHAMSEGYKWLGIVLLAMP